jgi:hypothetical protein
LLSTDNWYHFPTPYTFYCLALCNSTKKTLWSLLSLHFSSKFVLYFSTIRLLCTVHRPALPNNNYKPHQVFDFIFWSLSILACTLRGYTSCCPCIYMARWKDFLRFRLGFLLLSRFDRQKSCWMCESSWERVFECWAVFGRTGKREGFRTGLRGRGPLLDLWNLGIGWLGEDLCRNDQSFGCYPVFKNFLFFDFWLDFR